MDFGTNVLRLKNTVGREIMRAELRMPILSSYAACLWDMMCFRSLMNLSNTSTFFEIFWKLIVDEIMMLANKHPDNSDELRQIITKLSGEITNKDREISVRDREIEILREQLRLERMRQFAARSEKLPNGNQSCLFDEVEIVSAKPDEDTLVDVIEVPSHKRVRGKRKPLPDNLPREDVVVDLPEDQKICTKDGAALKEIGSDVSEKLNVVPAHIKAIRTIRKKYICPCCDDQANIKTAAIPDSILPKSNATSVFWHTFQRANTWMRCSCTGSRRFSNDMGLIFLAIRWRGG